MAEYGREQRNQLSRAIANSEEVCRQLKGFVDNRFNNELTLLHNSLYFHKQPCKKSVQRVENNNISPDSVNDILKDISKEELLAIIKSRVVEAGNELLAQINQTTDDCPYIRKWFTYYGEKDILSIIQAISRFAPLTNNASSLDEYIDSVIDRVRIGLQKHIDTGTVEDIPIEIMNENRKPTDFVHIAQSKNLSIQMSCCVDKEEPLLPAVKEESPEVKYSPKSVGIAQGQCKNCLIGTTVINVCTTSCALVMAFLGDEVVCYHWPFFLEGNDKPFKDEIGGNVVNKIIIVTNGFRTKSEKSGRIEHSRKIAEDYSCSVEYYVIKSETDQDPIVTLSDSGIKPISEIIKAELYEIKDR